MENVVVDLRAQLEKTACCLACRPVRLSLTQLVVFDDGRPPVPLGYGWDAWATCQNGEDYSLICIAPDLSIVDLYQTFLHEAAHAYEMHMAYPDTEAAAWEIASIWAVWIDRRLPRDTAELMQWLKQLEKYNEKNICDHLLTMGPNRGCLLPGPRTIHPPRNRNSN